MACTLNDAAVFSFVATSTQALLLLTARVSTSRQGLKLLDPVELLANMTLGDLQRSPMPEMTGEAGKALRALRCVTCGEVEELYLPV